MDKMKMGIVGMGQRTRFHGAHVFTDCRDTADITAICDNRPERLAEGKQSYEAEFGHEIGAYESYEEMYARAGLDGVYVAGPNYLHLDMTLAAFDAGLHVLCEKPMEVTLAKCDEMIEASKRTNKVLAMAMQMHFRKRYHKVKDIIAQGLIGKPAMVWCTEYRGPFMRIKDWVWDKEKSGGAIVEKNCHHYDIMNMWIQSPPTTVYATGNIVKHKNIYGQESTIVDNAWVINDFENGARAMLGVCFLAEAQHYREFGVHGTEGKIFFSGQDREVIHVELNSGEKSDHAFTQKEILNGGVFQDFVDCIRTGRKPLVDGETARQSMLVPLAAEKSIEEKRIVHVSELESHREQGAR